MAERSPSEVYGRAVDRMVGAAVADPRIRALWLEGGSPAELRRPYRRLEVHLACDEPEFAPLLGELESLVAGTSRLGSAVWSDVPRLARQLAGLLEGAPVVAILEKTSLLAKRPRQAVASLVDKTGHLTHVMDFSRRPAPQAP